MNQADFENLAVERQARREQDTGTPQIKNLSKDSAAKEKCRVRNSIADIKQRMEDKAFCGEL